MAFKDPDDAPKSDHFDFYKCDSCDNLHIAFFNEEELAIATAVFSREQIQRMLDTIDEKPLQ